MKFRHRITVPRQPMSWGISWGWMMPIPLKIMTDGIEMMLRAVDRENGIPDFGSQCFKTYGDETISDVIKNHKDYEKDKISE